MSIVFFISCEGYNQNIDIKQTKSNYQVLLRLNPKSKELRIIRVPFEIEVYNNSKKIDSFSSIKYRYKDFKGIGRGVLFVKSPEKLIKVSNFDYKKIEPNTKLDFVIYSGHFIEKNKLIKNSLQDYVNKMKFKNQDTLSIGSLTEFKKKHPNILENLLQGDSVSLHYKNKKTGDFIIKKIPVQF